MDTLCTLGFLFGIITLLYAIGFLFQKRTILYMAGAVLVIIVVVVVGLNRKSKQNV